MSVSARDRKSIIYAELERFRALCDQQEQQLRAQSEANERLRKQLRDDHNAKAQLYSEAQQLRAQIARPQAPEPSERRAKLEDLKAFATKYRCTARWHNGAIELYSKKRQCWVAVPEGAQP